MLYSFPLLIFKKRHYICKYFHSTLQKQHWWRNTWIYFEVCSLYCVWPVIIISIALGKTRLLLVSSVDCSENPDWFAGMGTSVLQQRTRRQKLKEEARGSQYDCPMGSMTSMLVSRGGSSPWTDVSGLLHSGFSNVTTLAVCGSH